MREREEDEGSVGERKNRETATERRRKSQREGLKPGEKQKER